jgi:conjugal transfer pilin signal peptidase TrbI
MANSKYLYLLLVLITIFVSLKFGYAHNITQSLPYKHFFIVKNVKIDSWDYVMFAAPKGCQYKEIDMVKQVLGSAGGQINVTAGDVYVDSLFVGRAKTHSRDGSPLLPVASMTIPPNKYYVATPHVDSYDSRYSEFGLIDEKDIIGVAYPLW